MKTRFWLGAAVALVATLPAGAQVELRWNFKKGDKFYIEGTSTQKQTVSFAGQKMPQEMKQRMVESFEVLEAGSERVVIKRTIESAKMEVGGPGGDQVEQVAKKMEGTSVTATLDPKARQVTKLEGFEELRKKVAEGNPLLEQIFSSVLGEETLRYGIADALLLYMPGKPVKEGDKWTSDGLLPMGPIGSATLKGEYTYRGKQKVDGKDLDKIEATWTLAYKPPKEGAGGALPFKINKGEFKSDKATATILFDGAAGRLVQRDVTIQMKGKLSMNAMGQDFEMELDSEQTAKSKVSDTPPSK